MRSPADERPMADTYTGALGVRTAANLLLSVTLATIALGAVAALLAVDSIEPVLAIAASVSAIVASTGVLRFRKQPTSARAKAVEATIGLAMLVIHLALIAAIVLARGLELQ
jgi:hypothetical protein